MNVNQNTLQQVFIRVCRDSGFQLDLHRACELAARVVGKHPLDIWMAMPSLDVMFQIAAGTHPAARDRDGTRSAETACPAPVPQDCQARAEGIAHPSSEHPNAI